MAKQLFRFVGSECEIGQVRLDRFGQRVELESDFVSIAISGGAALLTQEQFHSLGFSEDDLKIWGSPFIDLNEVPADPVEAKSKAVFLVKRAKAQQLYCSIRDGSFAAKTGSTPKLVEEKKGE